MAFIEIKVIIGKYNIKKMNQFKNIEKRILNTGQLGLLQI